MMTPKRPLTRRTFLRGAIAGTAIGIALPPLEAMLGSAPAAAQAIDDRFFGLFYWANGTPWHAGHGRDQGGPPDLWTPPDIGRDYRPSELLAPLARHRVTAITGLEPHTAIPPMPPGQGDGHMRGFMVAMTGDRVKPEGFDHGSHSLTALRPTLDQYIARHPRWYDTPPPFRSIEAGVSEARFHDYGHWNGISYNGPYSLNLPIMRPRLLFDRLFVQRSERTEIDRRLIVLDAVRDDARLLRPRLGMRDRERLDAHLDHIGDLQRRLDAVVPVCQIPAPPGDGGDLIEKARVMGELLAIAVDCRLTRTFSLMLTAPATTHVFGNLGVPDGMHKTCHDGIWQQVRDITRHQMEAFAVFLDAFTRPRPDGGTLLDQGLIYATSEYGEGWLHSVKELPVLIAGRAGGAFIDNTHVRLPGDNLSRAQLTAMQALGLEESAFGWNGGEARDALPGLLA